MVLNATVGNLTYTNDPVIGNIIPGSAAEQAHLQSNDRILTIDGKKISTWDEIRPWPTSLLPIMVLLLLVDRRETVETTVIPKWNRIVPKNWYLS